MISFRIPEKKKIFNVRIIITKDWGNKLGA